MQAYKARLFKEYKEVQREKTVDPDIQLVCDDSNIFKWTALIKVGTVMMEKDGVQQYPLQPPQVLDRSCAIPSRPHSLVSLRPHDGKAVDG
ncbi:hypothetical protein Q3G72_007673 [Acer saccharum]|nr:hypothetical protein Q3G72_007673 [Acer saccharum]